MEALANKVDGIISISTSGKSRNVNNTLKLASKYKCKTIGFTCLDGEEMNNVCDINIIVPSEDTPTI